MNVVSAKSELNEILAQAFERAWTRDTAPCYVEDHHTRPSAMCRFSDRYGERDDYVWDCHSDTWDGEKSSVLLTGQEHYRVHYLLHIIYPDSKAAFRAWWRMCNNKSAGKFYQVDANDYEAAKIVHSKYASERLKGTATYRNKNSGEVTILSKSEVTDDWELAMLKRAPYRNIHTGEVKILHLDEVTSEWESVSKGKATYRNKRSGETKKLTRDQVNSDWEPALLGMVICRNKTTGETKRLHKSEVNSDWEFVLKGKKKIGLMPWRTHQSQNSPKSQHLWKHLAPFIIRVWLDLCAQEGKENIRYGYLTGVLNRTYGMNLHHSQINNLFMWLDGTKGAESGGVRQLLIEHIKDFAVSHLNYYHFPEYGIYHVLDDDNDFIYLDTPDNILLDRLPLTEGDDDDEEEAA